MTTTHVTVHEDENGRGEWVLVFHSANGSYAGIGALNGEIEARIIERILNAVLKPREWSDLAEELRPQEGPYANFAAWCQWVQTSSIQGIVDGLEITDKVALYEHIFDMMKVPGEDELRSYFNG